MAEGLLRRLFAQAGVGASVGSAGLLRGGAPATPDAVATMADRRVDIADHVSQTVSEEMVRDAPLILAMTRHHVRELCAGYGAPMERTFTLKELVRRGAELGGRVHGESVYAWLARLNAGRRTADLIGDDPADDVADPVGQPRDVYEITADELEDQLRRFVQLLVGGPPRSAAYADGARVRRADDGRSDEYAGDPSIRY
jgi:protein-tyrosine phosphatase